MSQRVFVTGIGIISGIGNNVDETLQSIKQKKSGVTEIKYLETIHKGVIPVSEVKLSEDELIKANAALSAVHSQTKVSKLLYRNSYASYMPDVNLTYSHGWRENNTLALDDYSPKTVMVNFSIPLFTSFQNLTKTKSSYYEYKQNKENYHDQLKNTRFVLTETANKIINLKIQRELSKANVEFNKNNYKVIEKQKERGLISNIDFIDAKLNLQNAELGDINNHYDFISAMVELYYLLGKLDEIVNVESRM